MAYSHPARSRAAAAAHFEAMSETTDSAGHNLDQPGPSVVVGGNPRPMLLVPAPGQTGDVLGYARVSKSDGTQVLDRQIDALAAAGCARIFSDQMSGMRSARPGLDACLDYARAGDTICIVEISRLGRRTADVVRLIEDLDARSVGLRILNLGLDTGDAQSAFARAFLQIAVVLAALERDLLVERTKMGLQAAAARGRKGGRPPALSRDQVVVAREWVDAGQSYADVGRLLGVSERTIRRHVAGVA